MRCAAAAASVARPAESHHRHAAPPPRRALLAHQNHGEVAVVVAAYPAGRPRISMVSRRRPRRRIHARGWTMNWHAPRTRERRSRGWCDVRVARARANSRQLVHAGRNPARSAHISKLFAACHSLSSLPFASAHFSNASIASLVRPLARNFEPALFARAPAAVVRLPASQGGQEFLSPRLATEGVRLRSDIAAEGAPVASGERAARSGNAVSRPTTLASVRTDRKNCFESPRAYLVQVCFGTVRHSQPPKPLGITTPRKGLLLTRARRARPALRVVSASALRAASAAARAPRRRRVWWIASSSSTLTAGGRFSIMVQPTTGRNASSPAKVKPPVLDDPALRRRPSVSAQPPRRARAGMTAPSVAPASAKRLLLVLVLDRPCAARDVRRLLRRSSLCILCRRVGLKRVGRDKHDPHPTAPARVFKLAGCGSPVGRKVPLRHRHPRTASGAAAAAGASDETSDGRRYHAAAERGA